MKYVVESTAQTLKGARQAKGVSQRSLSEQTGITQANISKIENGGVDIKISTLIELARALDLEVTLVPRRAVPAVQSLVRISRNPKSPKEISRIIASIEKVGDLLSAAIPNHIAARKISENIREFENFQLQFDEIEKLDRINEQLKMIHRSVKPGPVHSKSQILSARNEVIILMKQLFQIRKKNSHTGSSHTYEAPRPAYTLDEENDNG
jgi:transcriptional regulator with XRE-family HTH domain